MENRAAELQIPRAKIFIVLFSLVLKFCWQISGEVSQQGELLIMNSLGAINSIWDWKSLNWKKELEEISTLPIYHENSSYNFEEFVKTILKWIVVTRIVISHLYPVTYVANFYTILTLCREKLLIPWLAMSAVKNFILEFIVIIVVILLYLQNSLSIYLVFEFFIHKLITLAPAVYNWLTINSLYFDMKMMSWRKMVRRNTSLLHRKSDAVFNHPNLILGLPMQNIHLNYHQILNSNIKTKRKCFSLMDCNVFPLGRSSSWQSLAKIDISSNSDKENQSYTQTVSSQMSKSSNCACSTVDDSLQEAIAIITRRNDHYIDQETTTDDFFHENMLIHNWSSRKMNHNYGLTDYTTSLNRYNVLNMKKFSNDVLEDCESCITVIYNFQTSPGEKSKQLNECDINECKKKLEIMETGSETSAPCCKRLGLSKSWIFREMIVTETLGRYKKSIDRLNIAENETKLIEIQALKAYNEKTLQKDRERFERMMKKNKRRNRTSGIRRAIENLDWSLKSFPLSFSHSIECNSRAPHDWHTEFSTLSLPIPHDNAHNTCEMLMFAFGYSDRSAVNGLDLGPPSEIYSSTEQIPNVFFEIIKTAVWRTIKHDCSCRSTADVDYGDKYWMEINI